ncbi:Uncharacterised protein [Enterobacter cloacae]|nr:hypothetical protein AI2797V1_0420 [Enterobacter cloacae]SAH53691.1 Uncharacterised protein [Enterobacter hormaechei]SXE97116.1 UmuC [Klebsiella variicola]CAE7789531.1 hypothetical protein AI2802V1_0419 [Enterobacter cloacae]CAH3493067.1 hypothetical protein AI2797V1_0420 [Enterobacter cloacae]
MYLFLPGGHFCHIGWLCFKSGCAMQYMPGVYLLNRGDMSFICFRYFHLCNSLLNKSTSVLHGKHLRHSEMLIPPISKYFIRIQPRANSDELMKVLDGINHSGLGKCE